MERVARWLEQLGLGKYAAAFAAAGVDRDVLPDLSEEDLERLGVTLCHRKKLVRAIAELAEPPTKAPLTPAREGERRQLTVMFCDLVGSTALASRLDLEDLREVIGRYHACVAAAVARFEGFVAKYMGDGVLVYFGYPLAHENDPEQAIRAGLALIDAIRELPAPQRLQVRIGIASGLAVVGDLIGTGSAQEQAVVGETPNLAARLQTLGEPGAIVVAESTRRQVGALFELRPLGSIPLRGFAEPQPAWRVVAENRALGRFEALRSGITPLVGRGGEMALLVRSWAEAKAGSGRIVLISAEAGVGKSRLAAALDQRIAPEARLRRRYFCSPYHQDTALYPVIAELERTAGFAHEDAPEEKLAKLRTRLAAVSPSATDLALMAELLSLPAAELALPRDLTPLRKKDMTFELLLRNIERLASREPAFVVCEDLHWIDPSSLDLLDRAIERLAHLPVLLVATFRPEFRPRWSGRPHVTTLALTRLDRSDAVAMVANVAGSAALPREVVGEIAERTDGVPLFIEELTKAVLESGVYAAARPATGPAARVVPVTLHGSLLARLDRLGPAAKSVAQTGAVIGREFGYQLLAAVAELAEPELLDALGRLTEAGLLFASGAPPRSNYVFKHALVQDAAYATLLRGRRQLLHARVAATVEAGFPEIATAQPAVLARHCGEAGLAEKAVVYWVKAGRQALARSAMAEAVAQLRKGLDASAALPDGPLRREHELDLQIALRTALASTKGPGAAEVGNAIARARALAEATDRRDYLVPLVVAQWAFHFSRSEHKLALPYAEQIGSIGAMQNDAAVELLGRRAQAQTCCFLGEFVAADALLSRSGDLSDTARRAIVAGMSDDPQSTALAIHALVLVYLGYIDRARARMATAVEEARRLGYANTLAVVLLFANWVDLLISPDGAIRHSDELLALATERGFPLFLGAAKAQRGSSLIALGQAREGRALLAEGFAALRAIGSVVSTPNQLFWLARSHAGAGELAEGLDCLAEAVRFIETTDERIAEAELYRQRGNLLKAAGDRLGAERDYRRALAVAERQRAKLLELRAAGALARLWREDDRVADAYGVLAPVHAWFTEGFDAPDLRDATALLQALKSG